MALADIVAAEAATTTPSADTPPAEPATDPNATVAPTPPETLPSDPPADPPSEPPAEPETDPFIARASEITGMDLSAFKDEASLLQSYAATKRKLSERDQYAQLGESILAHPKVDQIRALLEGKDIAPPPPPPPPTSDRPEYDPAWEIAMQNENPPPEIAAKYQRYRQWQHQRAQKMLDSDILVKLAEDPEAAIAELLDKRLAPVVDQLNQTKQEREQSVAQARWDAVVQPVANELFTAGREDWEQVTPLGAKVAELWQSNSVFQQADPVGWLQHCIGTAKAQMPQPKPTKTPSQAASRTPAVGAPPADTRSLEQILEEAANDGKSRSLAEWNALVAQHTQG